MEVEPPKEDCKSISNARTRVGGRASEACWLEATAPKVGNVHPTASFADMTYHDFEQSAYVIGSVFDQADQFSIGQLVLEGVRVTRAAVGKNTNLGTLILLAPICKAFFRMSGEFSWSSRDSEAIWDECDSIFVDAVQSELDALTESDSHAVYEAIRTAQPGGIGKSQEMDVRETPPEKLMDAMRLASSWDQVAADWSEGFSRSRAVARNLLRKLEEGKLWSDAICSAQLQFLATQGDSLIRRKCGQALEYEVRKLAMVAWNANELGKENAGEACEELDRFLRMDGHRRNPGSSADIIAAGILLALWQAEITSLLKSTHS